MEFLSRALEHGPVNPGDSGHGAWYRSERGPRPRVHWSLPQRPEPQAVIGRADGPSAVTAVFDDHESVRAFVEELREADLGLSIEVGLRETAGTPTPAVPEGGDPR